MSTSTIPVADVVVGERARREYGDLTSLMDSIREHGLLQPIGLSPGNHLLFGGRRLEAVKQLGMTEIPVTRPATRTDALSLLQAERDENTCRKDMTLSELVAVGKRIEELERPKALERMRSGTPSDQPIGGSGEDVSERTAGETRRVVGEALGVSGATYQRAKKVIEAAEDETAPEEIRAVAQEAVNEMDETGKAWMPYQKVQAAIRPESAKPQKKSNLTRPQPPKFGGNRKKHAAVIDSISISLTGLAMAADDITEFDNTVTQEEAARLANDLSASIRSLNRLKQALNRKTTS